MIDRKMKKKDLIALSGISRSTVAKLTRDENVNTDVLVRICKALACDVGDIMEVVSVDKSEQISK